MNTKRWFWTALLVTVGSTLSLNGCIVAPVPGPYYVGEAVPVAPPPLPQEIIGVAPAVGYIWIGGYWNWVGGRHVWVPGRWEAPRPGYHWVPHRWVQAGPHWRLTGGYWARH